MRHNSPTSKSRLRLRLAPFDLIWALVAPVLALALRDPGLLAPGELFFGLSPAYIYAFSTAVSAMPAFMVFRINDGISRFFSVHDVLAAIGAVAAAVGASSVILFMFTRLEGVPRSTPVICALVMLAGLLFARILARMLHNDDWPIDARPSLVAPRRRVLLIGVDRFAAIAVKLFDSQRPRSTEIVAALDPRSTHVGRQFRGVKIVGNLEDFEAVIDEYAVHGVVINEVWRNENVASLSPRDAAHISERCAARGLQYMGVAEALNLSPQIEAAPSPATFAMSMALKSYFECKRLLDVAAAVAMTIIFTPLTLIVAGLTFLDVGLPILFWQQRVGRNGRAFRLYKFRTFQAPFDNLGDRVPERQRLSTIGRAIRATRLDEIPQLINVLKGDMSIVGPRPLLPQDQPADPRMRLSVRPGITGWAQINGGAQITPEDKDALDAWYIRHASLMLDCLIIIRTLLFLLTGEKLQFSSAEEASESRSKLTSASPAKTLRKAA